MQFTRHFLALSMVTLLSACASTAHQVTMSADSSARNQTHLQRNAAIQQFSLQGRIGVQTNSKGFSGGLQWQHSPTNDNIALLSPLGGQVAQITKSSDQITLTDANGKQISATNAETLTYNALGWSLPLTGLSDWSLGRPSSRMAGKLSFQTTPSRTVIGCQVKSPWKATKWTSNYWLKTGITLPISIAIHLTL